MKQVILCNDDGAPTGTSEVWDAHLGEGKLHLAFSACVFRNDRSEMLIQRRNHEKLFGGYWANTCCSHPRPESDLLNDAKRRMREELGFSCELSVGPSFVYKSADPDGKGTEYEFDTILTGDIGNEDIQVVADPAEVSEHKWVKVDELESDMKTNPEIYAPWFHIIMKKLSGVDN